MTDNGLQENRIITEERLQAYRLWLIQEEKRKQTIEKYVRDVRKLIDFLAGREVTKEMLICYKEYLENSGKYTPSSINSFLSAANSFCEQTGWDGLRIKAIRIQHQTFETEEKELNGEEYRKLIKTALKKGKEQLALIIQTLGSTGIRISELRFVTVESLKRGMSDVYNKGKVRRIMYPGNLVKVLHVFARKKNIRSGSIFCTKRGKNIDRSNVWREMKKLCKEAGIAEEKVFPHNLRHLFARCFYRLKKDIAVLSDVLGHSNVSTTRIYIKSTGKEHRRQLDMMHMVIVSAEEIKKSGNIKSKKKE